MTIYTILDYPRIGPNSVRVCYFEKDAKIVRSVFNSETNKKIDATFVEDRQIFCERLEYVENVEELSEQIAQRIIYLKSKNA